MESRHVIVCDYIAGMTDQFLLRQHHEHFGESGRPQMVTPQ
jgi:dGTP triphosphohydrolase